MNVALKVIPAESLSEAVRRLGEATAAKKCWGCGCLHNSLEAIERTFPNRGRPPALDAAISAARQRLVPVRYDCLGCEVCYPPLAMNALGVDTEACPAEEVEARAGWPPLPGSYTVLQYHAPVAVCTLTDEALATSIAAQAGPHVAIVGSLYTENLGIERIMRNVLANPNIRFLVLCGPDSRQTIGHLPGQSLLALAANGLDERGRIIGAQGRRPLLRNISREAVEHFRRTVEVVDLVGSTDTAVIATAVADCGARNPGPAEPMPTQQVVAPVRGYLHEKMVSDPAGYFVVYVDRQRRLLALEHYASTGVLDTVIEGTTAAELYLPAIDKNLLSRLDHAAYLGRELARAEHALRSGEVYVQDAAPERATRHPTETAVPAQVCACGCSASCRGDTR